MGRACCILGCPSGGDAPSHQIPKNPVLFQKWKDIIYSEKIQHMTDEQISKCTVCYRHFSSEDYLITYRVRKLKRGIAPSLNLPNRPAASSSGEPSTVETKLDVISKTSIAKDDNTDIPDIVLFEDAPETLEPYLFKQSPERILPNERIERADSVMESAFQSYWKRKASRRKRARLKDKQIMLLRCKKQVERYERTPTIRKLISLLTAGELSAVKAKIQKSRYLPKVCVKVYNEIAKNMALFPRT